MAKKDNPLKVVTPKFRLSFPELFEAKSFDGQDAKFSLQMLFDKGTDLSALKKVVQQAAKEKWGGEVPKGILLPFRDGNEKSLDGYEDTIVVGASSKFKPQVVNAKLDPVFESSEVYAGCYARASVTAYAWEYKNPQGKVMKRGVSFALEAVQKLADGEPFVKRTKAEDIFDAVEESSEDKSKYENDDFDFDL